MFLAMEKNTIAIKKGKWYCFLSITRSISGCSDVYLLHIHIAPQEER
jgi:hypothetical protein